MSNIGVIITFRTATNGAICWPSSPEIPRFRNSWIKGSLILEIPRFRNFEQMAERPEKKNTFFTGFLPTFRPVFYFFTNHLYKKCNFCKKNWFISLSSHRSADCKVQPHVGGRHFLLCQLTSTKDIAGQSATKISAFQTLKMFL